MQLRDRVVGNELSYFVRSEDVIEIPALRMTNFLTLFGEAKGFKLVMPSNLQSVNVNIGNTGDGKTLFGSMLDCIKSWNSVNQKPMSDETTLHPTSKPAIAASNAVPADAETYDYSCKVDGNTYPLRVDTSANTLEWRGKSYSLTEADCGRVGWHAEGNGTAFDFCTATKGYASLSKGENIEAVCNLKIR